MEGFFTGEDIDGEVAGGCDFFVDGGFDVGDESGAHGLEFKVHAAFEDIHVAAGDGCAVVSKDDPAEDVHGGVGAHELIAFVPVELAGDGVADGGEGAVALNDMDVLAVDALDAFDGVCGSSSGEFAIVGGLAAPAWVEGSLVEDQAVVVFVHGGDDGLKFLQVAVGLVEEFGHGVSFG